MFFNNYVMFAVLYSLGNITALARFVLNYLVVSVEFHLHSFVIDPNEHLNSYSAENI